MVCHKNYDIIRHGNEVDMSNKFLLLGIIVFITLLNVPAPDAIGANGWHVIAVISLMLIWWVSEAVPIAVTALLPIVLFPVLGVLPLKTITANYGHPIVFLFFGGFVIAIAMQKWNLHKRIALSVVRRTGVHANGIILGFMLATAFLSMWISNTATTVMMLPIAVCVLALIAKNNTNNECNGKGDRFALSLMIAVAFAANIGGTATLTGTPPNAIFAAFIEDSFGIVIDYYSWMMVGVPFAICLLFITWFLLCFVIYPSGFGEIEGADELIEKEYQQLGKMSYEEKAVLLIFSSVALAWIFKSFIPIPNLQDAMISIMGAIILFLIPIKGHNLLKSQSTKFLLCWDDMKALPWGILLLFGGGLSVAGAMRDSGVIQIIGDEIASFKDLGVLMVLLISVSAVLLLTELMSNLALITIFLPVLVVIAASIGQDQFLLTIPATLASSCAFMLPMATPPNAIVFSSGYIRIAQMVKAGIVVNISSILLIMLFAYSVIPYVFDIGFTR